MVWEDDAGKNEQMSMGPDSKELQLPFVEYQVSEQQKMGRDFCSWRMTGFFFFFFFKANLKRGVLQHSVPGGKHTRLGAMGSRPYRGWCCGCARQMVRA